METAAELLGRHLGVGRCGYGELDATSVVVRVERDWTDGSMPSAAGIYHLRNYGPALVDDLRAGRTVRVEDPAIDPRMTDDEACAHARTGRHARQSRAAAREARPVRRLALRASEHGPPLDR